MIMNNENRNKSAIDTLKQISNNLDYLSNSEDEKDLELKNETKEDIERISLFLKKIKRLILFTFSLLVTVVGIFGYFIYQYERPSFTNSDLNSKKTDSIVEAITKMKKTETKSDIVKAVDSLRIDNDNTMTLNELTNGNNKDSISILSLVMESSTIAGLALSKNKDNINISKYSGVENNDTINKLLQNINKENSPKFMILALQYDDEKDVWYAKDRE